MRVAAMRRMNRGEIPTRSSSPQQQHHELNERWALDSFILVKSSKIVHRIDEKWTLLMFKRYDWRYGKWRWSRIGDLDLDFFFFLEEGIEEESSCSSFPKREGWLFSGIWIAPPMFVSCCKMNPMWVCNANCTLKDQCESSSSSIKCSRQFYLGIKAFYVR